VRFNELRDPEPIPANRHYSHVIESDVPIVVRHTRLDSRQAALALLTTIACAEQLTQRERFMGPTDKREDLDTDDEGQPVDPEQNESHGTGALGPSDSSDSGSDVRGGRGLAAEVGTGKGLGLDPGPMDLPGAADERDAGPDIGDAGLDSDSDAGGTGERAAAGRDAPDRSEIGVDHIETVKPATGGEDKTGQAAPPTWTPRTGRRKR
jgi:sensory rhodopsin transducer